MEAGLEAVPCIVRRGLDKKAQAELRLVENLHRRDLSPLEEARALADLVKLGVSQRELAGKIGRSQAHISRRLGLLLLPRAAQEALDTGRITIEQATALARMHDEPERIARVLEQREPRQIDSWLRYQLEEFTKAKKRAEVIAELERQGVQIRDFTRGCDELNFGLVGVTVDEEAHAKEPCHVVSVGSGGEITPQCSDRDRHAPGGASTLKATNIAADGGEKETRQERINRGVTEETNAPRSLGEARRERREDPEWQQQLAEEEARLERRRAAISARRDFAGGIVRSGELADAIDLMAMAFLECQYIEDPFDDYKVLELLGVEPDTYNQRRPVEQVRDFMDKGHRNRARALAAAAVMVLETDASLSEWALRQERCVLDEDFVPQTRAWLGFLVERGYTLSEFDRELIPEAEPPPEPAPDGTVAWYDDPDDGPRWVEADEASAIEISDPGRLHRIEVNREEPTTEHPGVSITVKKSGKRFKVRCSTCGEVGSNTTEEYANERGRQHQAEKHGSEVPA